MKALPIRLVLALPSELWPMLGVLTTFTYGMRISSRAVSDSYRFVYEVRVPNGFYQDEWDTKSDVGQTLIKSKKWIDLG